MNTYTVTLTLTVEARSHADALTVAQDAIRAKNAALLAERKQERIEMAEVLKVKKGGA